MCRAEFREADMIQLDDTHRGEDRIPSGFKKKEGGVGEVDLEKRSGGSFVST